LGMSICNELRLQRGAAATCFERIVAAAREEVEVCHRERGCSVRRVCVE
jgi:hypothetical protein